MQQVKLLQIFEVMMMMTNCVSTKRRNRWAAELDRLTEPPDAFSQSIAY
jgi:hypothetical protein